MTVKAARRRRLDAAARRLPRRLRRAALAGAALVLAAAPATGQTARPGVVVDLGALDALGPPAGGSAAPPVHLHRPVAAAPKPATAAAPRSTAPASPPQTAAAKPPQTAALPPSPSAKLATPPPPDLPPVGPPVVPTPPPDPVSAPPPVLAVQDRIVFPADGVTLPDEAKPELDQLAKRLSADARLYVQLVGYAAQASDASQARRISLSRALAARSYLIDRGVLIKQVDVRPLGNKSEPGLPPDRVDLLVAER